MRQLERNQNGITEGVIWQQLLIYFFPIMLGTFFQQMYNTVDAVIVGRFVGKQALAAVGGSTGTLINLVVGFFVGLSSGATVIIAQYYGGKSYREVSQAVHTAVALSLAAGALLTVAGIWGSPWALAAMNTPQDVMAPAVSYIRIYFSGMIASLLYNIGSGILRAVGDARRPLYFLIVSCAVNIALDLLFVVGLGWGVTGVAVATVISQLVSAALVAFTLMRTSMPYRLELKKIRFSGDIFRRIVRIGLPAGLQSVMYSASNIIIQTAINAFGTDSVAAWTAYSKIDGLFWMIMGAFGVSITTFVGQNFGAGQYGRMKKSVRVCLGMALGASLGISGLLLAGGEAIYRLFTDDPQVLEKGMQVLRTLVPFYFTYICVEVLSGAVRGTGDSLLPMILTCLGVCVLRVVWVAVAVPLWPSITCVILSYPITWTVTSILFILYYLKGGWLKRRIAASGQREG